MQSSVIQNHLLRKCGQFYVQHHYRLTLLLTNTAIRQTAVLL